MATRLNFDNPGLQTGLDVGSIAADFELRMIINRKQVFENAVKSGDFKTGVYNQLAAYNDAGKSAVADALKAFQLTVATDFKDTYNRGVKSVETAVQRYEAAGIALQTPPKRDATVLSTFLAVTLGTMLSALLQAQRQAQSQMLTIASLAPQDGDIRQNLDRMQKMFPGLTVDGTGGAKRISAYAEFTERNQSQKLLLSAQGARAADYGLKYAQISGHPSSCPLCTPWQGKIVLNDVFEGAHPDGKTPLMSEAINDGLFHFNCRHTYTPYIPGFDRKDLYKKDIASPEETAKRYAIEQQQRYNERNIRDWKLREAAAMTDTDRALAEKKVAEWQAQQRTLREVAKDQGVPFYRQYSREQIGGETKPSPVLLYNQKGAIIDAKEAFYNLSYEKVEHLKDKMNNFDVREYYIRHIESIQNKIDHNAPLEDQAKQAFNLRNEARTYARELMADAKERERLNREYSNLTWEEITEHKRAKGFSGEGIYENIITTATESNQTVNRDLGIKRKKA